MGNVLNCFAPEQHNKVFLQKNESPEDHNKVFVLNTKSPEKSYITGTSLIDYVNSYYVHPDHSYYAAHMRMLYDGYERNDMQMLNLWAEAVDGENDKVRTFASESTYELQLAYHTYLCKAWEQKNARVPVCYENESEEAEGSNQQSIVEISDLPDDKTHLTLCGFEPMKIDHDFQITMPKNMKNTLKTRINSPGRIFIPLKLTRYDGSAHIVGIYYEKKSKLEDSKVYVFDAYGSKYWNEDTIKYVRPAVDYVRTILFPTTYETTDEFRLVAGHSKLHGVQFRGKFQDVVQGQTGTLECEQVYTSDQFMKSKNSDKESYSRCYWAVLRYLTWVMANNKTDHITFRGYPVKQEMLFGLVVFRHLNYDTNNFGDSTTLDVERCANDYETLLDRIGNDRVFGQTLIF